MEPLTPLPPDQSGDDDSFSGRWVADVDVEGFNNQNQPSSSSTSTSVVISSSQPLGSFSTEEPSLVVKYLAKVSEKLSKLIKTSESKKLSIRTRLLKGELEPKFLALEHKVVAAEHIRTLEDLQTDVEKLRRLAADDSERKDNELKSQSEVFKEELFKDVMGLLETELSCVVCSEVFVQVNLFIY